MHYYQHHIGDFIKATNRLTDSQCMTYLRLLWMYYDTEKPLDNNPELIAFQLGTTAKEIELLFKAFFIIDESLLTVSHKRCDIEIKEFHAFVDKKAAAGRESARKRAEAESARKLAECEQPFNTCSTPVEQPLNSSSTTVQLPTTHYPLPILNTLDTNVSSSENNGIIIPEEKPSKEKLSISVKDLIKIGIDEQVAKDFLSTRKTKLTLTAIKGIQNEALKANISLSSAFKIATERGWQSFKAEWIKDKNNAGYVSFEELAKGDDYDPTNKF